MGVNIFLMERTSSITYIKSHSYGNFSNSELYVAVSFFRLHGQFLTSLSWFFKTNR